MRDFYYVYIDVFDVLDVDVRCACGLDVGPRQYGTNPGGALPCEPDTVRSRVITSTFKGINPESWHQPSGRRRSGAQGRSYFANTCALSWFKQSLAGYQEIRDRLNPKGRSAIHF